VLSSPAFRRRNWISHRDSRSPPAPDSRASSQKPFKYKSFSNALSLISAIMRNNFCVAALALAVATAAFAPTNTRRTSLLKKLSARSDVRLDQVAKPSPLPRTNAQRLARGLPLLKPRFRGMCVLYNGYDSASHSNRPPSSTTRTEVKHPTRHVWPISFFSYVSQPVDINRVRCNIKVASYDTPENVYGYLAPDIDLYGTLGTFLPDQTGAVEVSFTYSSGSYTQLDLAVTNSPSYPVIGAGTYNPYSGLLASLIILLVQLLTTSGAPLTAIPPHGLICASASLGARRPEVPPWQRTAALVMPETRNSLRRAQSGATTRPPA
jgi:hypothetical protein